MQERWLTQLVERLVEWAMSSGIRVALIGIGMLVLLAVTRQVLKRLRSLYEGALPSPAERRRADTLTHVLRDVARIFIVAVGTMMVLSEIGIDLKPLLAAAGLGGLAIGFGAQSLVKDVISGFFILLEDSIAVGDVVEIAGVSGVVEEVK
ncbi:MAG: mechanosensitive ion channel, partial [Nitrospira sp.]|nr:mechanosensitive ion channel [Nitrospira sp.]